MEQNTVGARILLRARDILAAEDPAMLLPPLHKAIYLAAAEEGSAFLAPSVCRTLCELGDISDVATFVESSGRTVRDALQLLDRVVPQRGTRP